MDIKAIDMKKDAETQIVVGHAGFIKTIEDLYEAMITSSPGIKFGAAFSEASGPLLVRSEGNDAELKALAEQNTMSIGAGHTFVIMFKNAFPINLNNALKGVQEVVAMYCSTANPVQVLVAETKQGRGIVGIVDGGSPKGIEGKADIADRKKRLRDFGYKV